MELIWAFAKLLEYMFIIPLWWVSTYLAAFFYPVENDPKQDMIALGISFVLGCLIVYLLVRFT